MKYLLLCLALSILPLSGCATSGGVQTKQSLTFNVLQPTQDALIGFRDLELNLFNSHEIPQLTESAHRAIAAQLAIAFRAHAVATRAVRTWTPGSPVPIDVSQLLTDVRSIQALLSTLAIPTNSLLVLKAGSISQAMNDALGALTGR